MQLQHERTTAREQALCVCVCVSDRKAPRTHTQILTTTAREQELLLDAEARSKTCCELQESLCKVQAEQAAVHAKHSAAAAALQHAASSTLAESRAAATVARK